MDQINQDIQTPMKRPNDENNDKSLRLTGVKSVPSKSRRNMTEIYYKKMKTPLKPVLVMNRIENESRKTPIKPDQTKSNSKILENKSSKTPISSSKKVSKSKIKYDPRMDTGIPFIASKPVTKIVPFRFATDQRVATKQLKQSAVKNVNETINKK